MQTLLNFRQYIERSIFSFPVNSQMSDSDADNDTILLRKQSHKIFYKLLM